MDEDSPGWGAIDDALERSVGTDGLIHFSTGRLPDHGVYGIHALPVDCGWLLVTLGLTDLFSAGKQDQDISGWGHELTLLVPRADSDQAPPEWALHLLDTLGDYVQTQARPFAHGHRMDPGGPIDGGESALTALAFVSDPLIPSADSPHGRVDFLRVVGITADELNQMKQHGTVAVLEALQNPAGSGLTDPARRS